MLARLRNTIYFLQKLQKICFLLTNGNICFITLYCISKYKPCLSCGRRLEKLDWLWTKPKLDVSYSLSSTIQTSENGKTWFVLRKTENSEEEDKKAIIFTELFNNEEKTVISGHFQALWYNQDACAFISNWLFMCLVYQNSLIISKFYKIQLRPIFYTPIFITKYHGFFMSFIKQVPFKGLPINCFQ